MEAGNYAYPTGAIFDELPWMSMHPTYYAYPMPTNAQTGYPMTMQPPLPYPNMTNWCSYNTNGTQPLAKYKKKRNLFTKLQLNLLQRREKNCTFENLTIAGEVNYYRFAEKEHIRQPERDNFAQMIGLTGEQVKIWFQNQRYKRRHRENSARYANVTSSSGANTSVSSLSSPSPVDSPDSGNIKPIGIADTSVVQNENRTNLPHETDFQHPNYTQLYWESQVNATYYTNTNFEPDYMSNADEKLSSSIGMQNDLGL
ncbi:homeobox domain protein [Dictyocaulus viviparus]|uniref:Homeobox domain protein n=1 Tax=Dictyocaulus viviparus TaxID=29172 RepID=A0A0D8Y647_DICVI|nr:homeobox domain protein [Dictyocaulus viviparus]